MSMWDASAYCRALGLDLMWFSPSPRDQPLLSAAQAELCDWAAGSRRAEGSVVTDSVSAGEGDGTARKRKAVAAVVGASCIKRDVGDGSTKRCRGAAAASEMKEEHCGSESSVENGTKAGKNSKPEEPSKDYIHVRARRGQATDSHSLAERVRRERISQRMKILQDLVPGCKNVTGKALMLDEIINYVQSLQRQVEFLSMKLATVCPQLDFNKLQEMYCCTTLNSFFPLEASGAVSLYNENYTPQNVPFPTSFLNGMMDSALYERPTKQLAFPNELLSSCSQVDNLQSVISLENRGAEIPDCSSQGW